jgi:hypothetical protein
MPLPRSIANSGPRVPTIGDQQQQSDLAIAMGHAIARNSNVAKVLCYLSVMRGASCIEDRSKAVVAHKGVSVPQDFQATGGNEAAHILPGCLSIQNKTTGRKPKGVWEFAPNDNLRSQILSLFEATHDLPVSFNKADSAAEARRQSGTPGLKQIFREISQDILDQRTLSLKSGERIAVVDRPAVLASWRKWAQGSLAAFELAASKKGKKILAGRPKDVLSAPRTDLAGRTLNEWTKQDLDARERDRGRTVKGATGTVEEFDDQERFLRAYARALGEGFPLSEANINKIELPFGKQLPDWFEP